MKNCSEKTPDSVANARKMSELSQDFHFGEWGYLVNADAKKKTSGDVREEPRKEDKREKLKGQDGDILPCSNSILLNLGEPANTQTKPLRMVTSFANADSHTPSHM